MTITQVAFDLSAPSGETCILTISAGQLSRSILLDSQDDPFGAIADFLGNLAEGQPDAFEIGQDPASTLVLDREIDGHVGRFRVYGARTPAGDRRAVLIDVTVDTLQLIEALFLAVMSRSEELRAGSFGLSDPTTALFKDTVLIGEADFFRPYNLLVQLEAIDPFENVPTPIRHREDIEAARSAYRWEIVRAGGTPRRCASQGGRVAQAIRAKMKEELDLIDNMNADQAREALRRIVIGMGAVDANLTKSEYDDTIGSNEDVSPDGDSFNELWSAVMGGLWKVKRPEKAA